MVVESMVLSSLRLCSAIGPSNFRETCRAHLVEEGKRSDRGKYCPLYSCPPSLHPGFSRFSQTDINIHPNL